MVEYVLRLGMTPEEMVEEWTELSMAHIHGALAYYFDHQQEIDREIEENRRAVPPSKGRR